MANGISTTGRTQMQANQKKLMRKFMQATADGLTVVGNNIGTESQKLVPVDEGDLKASLFVVPVPAGGEGAVGYGAKHAAIVHERTDISHKTGQAKFLSEAEQRKAKGFERVIANWVQRAVTVSGPLPSPPKPWPENPRG